MKNLITIISFAVVFLSSTAFSQLLLTAVYDGPIPDPLHDNAPKPPRGLPRGVELYAASDIADLSIFGLGSASENNDPRIGGIEEFTLSASAGDFIYVSYHVPEFTTFF